MKRTISDLFPEDTINPSHYKGEVECIDAIKSSLNEQKSLKDI